MKKREITIPTILGLLVALGGLLSGLWLVQSQVRKSIQASAEQTPQEVQVSNVTDTSFTVSWVTTKAVSGFIQYGEGQSEQNIIVTDDRDQQKGAVGDYFTHLVTAKGLKPGTVYGFSIGSGNKTYDSEGVSYQVKTGLRIDSQPAADVAYGQVATDGGEPAEGALVYLTIPGGGLEATLVKPSGSWVIPLSTIRSLDLANFVKYDKKTTQIEINVNGGIMGKSEVTLFTEDDSPVPEIVLGKNYNYVLNRPKPEVASESGSLAEQAASKISLSPGLNVLTPKSGEKTNSLRPEIIGTAPAGAEITIEINSDEVITGKVTADGEGNFSFSVPNDLPPGEHTLTVTSMVNGVLKTVTRVFTVYAAGESNAPAYSATPSATITPRLSPTPSVKPTAIPIPTATPKPTTTPRVSPTPTSILSVTPTKTPTPSPTIIPTATPRPTAAPKPTAVPTPPTQLESSGSTDQTIWLLILGTVLTAGGWWWYKKAS